MAFDPIAMAAQNAGNKANLQQAAQAVRNRPDFVPAGQQDGTQQPANPMAPPVAGIPAAPAPPPPMLHDVIVRTTKKMARARAIAVAPENFGIEKSAASIAECNYCFMDVVNKTAGDWVAEGFDAVQIAGITDYTGLEKTETLTRDTVDEHMSTGLGGPQNDAQRIIKVTEHYMRFDYEGTGLPRIYQIITAGDQGEILRKNGKDCITAFDVIPFAATTPVPMTHRFFGRSIADLVMPLQREKTALKRGALDNLYQKNNPRVEVGQDKAGPMTLDDLLVSRAGGVVRTRQVGALNWQQVPDAGQQVLQMMAYIDSEIESRTGQSKQSQGLDANALQNQSATATAQVFSASQMRMKLLARILAEGVRDIFSLLHGTIRKHGQQSETVRLRNAWLTVDPRNWKTRDDMTINVGLGTGGKAQQFAQTMALANVQKEFVAAGMTNIVGQEELYNTAAEIAKIMGHRSPDKFFKDPSAKDPQTGQLVNPPPPPKPDPKVALETAKVEAKSKADMQAAQQKAELQQQAVQADAIHQQQKLAAESDLAREKAELQKQLALIDAQIDIAKEAQKHKHDVENHQHDMAHKVVNAVAQVHAHDTAQQRADDAHQKAMDQQAAAADASLNALAAKATGRDEK